MLGGFEGSANDYLIRDGLLYLAGAYIGAANGLVCTFDGDVLQDYYTGLPNSEIAMSLAFYEDTLHVCGGVGSEVGEETNGGYAKCCKIVNGQLQKVAQGFPTGGFAWSVKWFQNKLFINGHLRLLYSDIHHRLYYYKNGALHIIPESALEIYCSAKPLCYQPLSRFLFLMYGYTPSNNPALRIGSVLMLMRCGILESTRWNKVIDRPMNSDISIA